MGQVYEVFVTLTNKKREIWPPSFWEFCLECSFERPTMGQLGGEDIAQAPHVNGQLGKSKTTPLRIVTRSVSLPARPQLDKVSVPTAAVMLCLTTQHKSLAWNAEFAISTFHFILLNQKRCTIKVHPNIAYTSSPRNRKNGVVGKNTVGQ